MKSNRRQFLAYSATGIAAAGSSVSFAGVTSIIPEVRELDANEQALAALKASPYASAAMPSMFSPMVDATAFENHHRKA